ncbi:site-2 protease family protein [Acidobacteria bacterium AB60]|nr:site-2 protease family protein [Acidobacteria bacterium AB60]
MATLGESVTRSCPQCGHDLNLGALACPECHSLIHTAELSAFAQEARALEERRDFAQAREIWQRSLALLPPDSKQADWIRDRLRVLESQANLAAPADTPRNYSWARRLGPLAPVVVLLAKSKGLLLAIFKLKFLFSFFSFIGLYVMMFGWRYGAGFAASILIHEMGHFIDIKRRGLPAEMPVFLPGFGAYVRWNALGVTKRQIAEISLAGPLAGWMAAVGCYWIFLQTHDPVWAALARTGAWLNVLNLIPVWTLDGSQAMRALGMVERLGVMAVALALWSYTGEWVFFFVVLGVGWRLYTKDKPEQDDWRTWIYFVAVLALLGVMLHALPAVPRNGASPIVMPMR